ncbi:hypothetical protein [Lacinutrix algicola]|uniref:hypothetical protein n=1 Tax=Lacinutrix algicola TaxID=342954 RepID=UPI0006E160B1|nr:hypothetical protein [Lacinutrix algicola]
MKNSSINKILNDKVLVELSTELKSLGFKLKKTESKLTFSKNGFSLVYWLYRNGYRFIWDEKSGNAFITFSFFTHLKYTDYNKWYEKQFKKTVNVEQFLRKDYLFLKLDTTSYNQNDFSEQAGTPVIIENDFFTTGIHQYETEKHTEFNKDFTESLKKNVDILENSIDLSFINERKGLPMEYVCLPHFYNDTRLTAELFDKHYGLRINQIENKIESGRSNEQIQKLSENLNDFIEISNELIQKEYLNPYLPK